MALRFPKDNQDYKGRVTFRSFAPPVPEVNIQGITKIVGTTLANFKEKTFDAAEVDVGDAANYTSGTQSNKRNYSGERVSLYLPQALTFRDAAEYSTGVELGAIGGTAEAAANQGQNIGGILGAAAREGFSTIQDLLTGRTDVDGDAARLAATRIARNFAGERGGNVARSVLRTTVNPNKRTLFRAVNLRDFSFQFKMIANSA